MFLAVGILGVIVVLLFLGWFIDRRDRRRSGSTRRSLWKSGLENRRDIRAWEHSTTGTTGEDLSWMHFRRGRP